MARTPGTTFRIALQVPEASVPVAAATPATPAPVTLAGSSPSPASSAPPPLGPSTDSAASPTAPPQDRPSSGGGGRSRPAATPTSGTVVDQFEVPVEGAEVLFANGQAATTDADGRFTLSTRPSLDTVAVSKAGYMGTLVRGLDALTVLHLRRLEAETAAFDLSTRRVRGSVAWPDADHAGGVAYYYDTLGGLAAPARVGADGRFELAVEPVRGGEARAAVLVLAQNAAGATLMGLTAPFELGDGINLPAVTMAAADTRQDYAAVGIEPALTVQESRLEVQPAGLPPIVLAGQPGSAGRFDVPPAGHLPGDLRVVVEARSVDGSRATTLSYQPGGLGNDLSALVPPDVTVDAAVHRVSWSEVVGARGYRIATRLTGAARESWEAWSPTATSLEVPDEFWPAAGLGEVVVEAIDAPGLDSRSLASLEVAPRRLRLAPWADAAAFRLASRRVPL